MLIILVICHWEAFPLSQHTISRKVAEERRKRRIKFQQYEIRIARVEVWNGFRAKNRKFQWISKPNRQKSPPTEQTVRAKE